MWFILDLSIWLLWREKYSVWKNESASFLWEGLPEACCFERCNKLALEIAQRTKCAWRTRNAKQCTRCSSCSLYANAASRRVGDETAPHRASQGWCLSVGLEWGAECRARWQLLSSWLLRRNGVVPAGSSSSEEMLHMTLTEVFVACICNWRQKDLQLKSSP